MHVYSVDDQSRRVVPIVLAGGAVVLGVISSALVAKIGGVPAWAHAPSALAWYAVLWVAFDRWLWKTALVRWTGVVDAPDLNGRWTATLTSSHDEHGAPHAAEVEIVQRWTRLIVCFKTATSQSASYAASLLKHGTTYRLVYTYRNHPHADAASTMAAHVGTAELDVGALNSMEGNYFSGHGRSNAGRLSLEREIAVV